jgi:hypothetical protein
MTKPIESCRGFDEATWHFFARLGLPPGFLRDNNRILPAEAEQARIR